MFLEVFVSGLKATAVPFPSFQEHLLQEFSLLRIPELQYTSHLGSVFPSQGEWQR